MPIEKVPVVHKFGIISHSQRLELQERLLKQSYLTSVATHKAAQTSRNPFEVTDKFIQSYNAAESLDDKEKLNDTAYKMLHRIKRRAGLKEGGTGEHVDLPIAWTELSQLAQCKGKIQEECLDVLITSLDQSPLSKRHIPALFFLAETTLYWLRTDSVHEPYLRTGEIKLLRMGQIVFTRLFYHHMAGQLQGHDEFKNRLFTYLDGFSESQEAYSPYPNALLSVRYINEVGKIVIGDCNMEAGEIKEGDRIYAAPGAPDDATQTDTSSVSRVSLPPSSPSIRRDHLLQMFEDSASSQHDETRSTHSAAISSSVHDLSPTLWHALDVWRCVHKLGGGLSDAVRALANCGQRLATESWVDGICGLQVLGDAAKGNVTVLRALQNLARGIQPKPAATDTRPVPHTDRRGSEVMNEASDSGTGDTSPSKSSHQMASHHSLSDIFEKSEPFTSPTKSHLTKTSHTKYADSSPDYDASPMYQVSPRADCGVDSHERYRASREASKLSRTTHQTGVSSKAGTEYTMANTACRAEVGSELGPDGRASQASTVRTFSNEVNSELPGLHGWHWEVSITYADILADICLHGNTSSIQKMALVGSHKDVSNLHRTAVLPRCPMTSAGLLDLVYFYAADESYDGGSNDWSWRVRYAAIQGLVKICRSCATDQTKEGMRTVAWTTLVKAHSQERDQRVLEALKVGQVESNIENLLSEHMVSTPETIGAKVASGLSVLYLPPLPPPVEPPSPRRRNKPIKPETAPTVSTHKPLRTTLRQEILLASTLHEPAPTYNSRTSFDLKRVVEDQWRKELQKTLEEEEEERQKELEKKQKEEEELVEEKEEKRKEKLQNKYRNKAYQYKNTTNKSVKTERLIKSGPSSLSSGKGRPISADR